MIQLEQRAWYISSLCEKLVGFWPYQNKMKNLALRIFNVLIISAFIFAMALRLFKEWNDNLHIVIENFIILISLIILLMKIVSISLLDRRRKQVIDQITTHFETIVDEDEGQILHEYSEKGLIFVVRCTILIVSSIAIYLAMPVMRMYFGYFFGSQSLEKQIPLYLDVLVDQQEYFYSIMTFIFFSLGYGAIIDFAFDSHFFITVRHICALFEIIKLRLHRASEMFKQSDQNNTISREDEAKAFEIISSVVKLHNEALQMITLLDEAYNVTWFIILLLNAMALAPVPVMIMLYKHDLFELIRRSMSMILFPLHFYIIFLQGQMTIDYSQSVFESCYDFCWYNTSKRCQVAISIMMRLSLKGCGLSGVLFELSMETYSVMLKTALSYISLFQALDL